jgi:heme-degrading monooxygenase HmoA
MVHVLVRHKVADFNRWKLAFDTHVIARQHAGETGFHVFHNLENANDIFLMLDWESADQARKFMDSSELRERMQQAGVEGIPEIQYLEDARSIHRSAAD